MKWIALLLILTQVIPQTGSSVISGQIRDAEGKPAVAIRVALVAPNADGILDPDALLAITQTDANGRYRIDNVPSGRFGIVAGAVQALTYFPGSATAKEATILTVRAGARINGMDFRIVTPSVEQLRQQDQTSIARNVLNAISLAKSPPSAGDGWVTGRVVFEGMHQWPDFSFMVKMEYSSSLGSGYARSTVRDDGTFRLQAQSGPGVDVQIGVVGSYGPDLPGDYYLKSISLDNRDLINKTFPLSTTNVPDVQIVFGIAAQISGNVQLQSGQPAANISMTFTSRGAADRSRFTRTAATNQGGDFSIQGLAPGEYIVSADAGNSGLAVSVSDQQNPLLLLMLKPDHTLSLRSP